MRSKLPKFDQFPNIVLFTFENVEEKNGCIVTCTRGDQKVRGLMLKILVAQSGTQNLHNKNNLYFYFHLHN